MSVCQLCSTEVARGPIGSTAKSWTTRNLLNHLEGHHQHDLAAAKPEHEKERLAKQYENPTPGFQKSRFQQAALADCMPGKKAWAVDDSRAKRINQKLIQMIVMDNQPFSIAEDDGFIAYSAALNPQYTMPIRTEVSEMLCPEYDRVREIIQGKINTAAFINFTSDLWTEDTTRAAFISLSGD